MIVKTSAILHYIGSQNNTPIYYHIFKEYILVVRVCRNNHAYFTCDLERILFAILHGMLVQFIRSS